VLVVVRVFAGDHVLSTVFVGAITVLIITASCIIPKYFISQNYFLYVVLSIYVPFPPLRGHIKGRVL